MLDAKIVYKIIKLAVILAVIKITFWTKYRNIRETGYV
jgi:hypothetical protein